MVQTIDKCRQCFLLMLFSGLVSDKRSYMANRERSWLSESLLIVISILVAFAIDAWWDERNDRKVEHRILASLLDC